ncbi:DUF7541 family protein [Haloarchaeobius sp. TZWWS8]|uniref:DUF7541 family protein n=1 Tax=Haloarchaeobius sp. TZWWS8 TaxID=3446121 RepID=UPI003EBAE873
MESETPDQTPSKPKASAWPMLIAVGLAISEVGVVFAVLPVSVFGLLLFCGSVAGIVSESGYVDEPWGLMVGFAAVLVLVGAGLFIGYGGTIGGESLIGVSAGTTAGGIAYRGVAIALAGVVTLAASLYGWFYAETQPGAAR